MKKLLALIALTPLLSFGQTNDFQKGIDFTGRKAYNASMFNQLVDNATLADFRGIIIATNGAPSTAANPAWTNYVWMDTSVDPKQLYVWSPSGSTWTQVTAPVGGINTIHLADNSVTSAKIADLTILGADIANSTITAGKYGAQSITTADIFPAAITSPLLANDAVQRQHLIDSAVGSAELADSSISANKYVDRSIASGKIQLQAVTTLEIADLAVTEDKLGPAAVARAKIADSAINSAKIEDGTIELAELKSGSGSFIIQMNSGGTAPNWVPFPIKTKEYSLPHVFTDLVTYGGTADLFTINGVTLDFATDLGGPPDYIEIYLVLNEDHYDINDPVASAHGWDVGTELPIYKGIIDGEMPYVESVVNSLDRDTFNNTGFSYSSPSFTISASGTYSVTIPVARPLNGGTVVGLLKADGTYTGTGYQAFEVEPTIAVRVKFHRYAY